MREIRYSEIVEVVAYLCSRANFFLPKDVREALERAQKTEESPYGCAVLGEILENVQIAHEEMIPLCQDCGAAVFFVEIGQEVCVTGGNLNDAIQEGTRKGYREGYLRKSMCDPFTRQNTGDNTPVIIHTDIVSGDKLKIILCPKGGGSENMSALKMLSPSQEKEGLKKFIIETVEKAGANPCPPIVVGVGIGGNFEEVALLAKKALLRPLGSSNENPRYAALEKEILEEINNLGIGPAGYGGRITALAVHIEVLACHIASLPVAVNFNCHSARHKEVVL